MKTLSKIERKEAMTAVREVYDELAARPVVRNCTRVTECCRFHVTGKIPHLTNGEALVAAHAFRASGRKKLPETDACPMLDTSVGKCLIYEHRPFGCRTHFCTTAGGPYERNEVADLIRKLEDIAARFFQAGKGGVPLPQAVSKFF